MNASNKQMVPIVAIGASAGGLEPLEAFFSAVPDKPGTAFVVVQHLSPDYRSMMDELLARKSSLPIHRIVDGMKIEKNAVFLNRPNMYVELEGDTFRTFGYSGDEGLPHLPIDRFFKSLAQICPDKSIAIVLSGSGSDGSKGAQALHKAGGAVLVQSVQEAGFTSMPRSVLLSGAVDRVLNAGAMPAAVQDILTFGKRSAEPAAELFADGIREILLKLESRYKIDFSSYKPDSVNRRIMRRLSLRGYGSISEYGQVLDTNIEALDELFDDILIDVTEFYRNREGIRSLRRDVLDKLAADTTESAPIKIWVPACASGEEVYTLGIELTEALREAGNARHFRIIGTDIHPGCIERASRGLYSKSDVEKVPEDLVDRYFTKVGEDYLIDPVLRQKVIFSNHNILSDPPFMNVDLVSCRNLLIYLKEEPQAAALSMFLFGLRREGYLFLGNSESLGRYAPAFTTINLQWRIFRKNPGQEGQTTRMLPLQRSRHAARGETLSANHEKASPRSKSYQAEISEVRSRDALIRGYDSLLKRFAPSSILLTVEGRVLNWFGEAGTFIDTMNNLADWTLQDIVHPDLHFPISVGIEKLRQGQAKMHRRQVKVDVLDTGPVDCLVEVEPLAGDGADWLILAKVSIQGQTAEEDGSADIPVVETLDPGEDSALLSQRIISLERDLRLTEETLQHVTERLEASGEELQASNEELQASNEELQASNEELQSSNEELHAVNEELVSVSLEHERKIELLSELNGTTETVLRNLQIGVMVLDDKDHIRRFSDLVAQEFLLERHDVERSINTVGPRLEFADLMEMTEGLRADSTPQIRSGVHRGRALRIEARRIGLGPAAEPTKGTVFVFSWGTPSDA